VKEQGEAPSCERESDKSVNPETDIGKLRRNLCLRSVEALFDTILHELGGHGDIDRALYTQLEERKKTYYDKIGAERIGLFTAERLYRDVLHDLSSF
jgi:hypothetical protein